MNKTMFTLIALDYLIFTFKVKRSAKNTKCFSDFLSFVSMVTAEGSGTLLFPIDYIDRLHEHIQVLVEK